MTGRFARQSSLAVGRQDAGVGDQEDPTECPHDNADCPDPDTGLPCLDCVVGGGA